ncbi:protein FAM210B, mitochondrial isoform X2 [Scyliorhinus canicula]|uniref:protein FAM210B, mitochondrial isoform X2 n=1 Tax=Scyliorhinus canicula TaxID=7830 RepID=UPI0018F6DB58|nr:protein FAM210B, mitochondrial isoform X2 [Scyliorhinus canicula]
MIAFVVCFVSKNDPFSPTQPPCPVHHYFLCMEFISFPSERSYCPVFPKSASGDGKTEKEARRFDNSDGRKLSKSQQLKQVFKEYGAVGVVFHTGISLTSLGMFYLVVSSGMDVAAILYKMGFNEAVVQSRMAAGTSTFLLAYAVHKVFAPVRMSITLISVPLIVRYFRKIGLFKASPSKPGGTI